MIAAWTKLHFQRKLSSLRNMSLRTLWAASNWAPKSMWTKQCIYYLSCRQVFNDWPMAKRWQHYPSIHSAQMIGPCSQACPSSLYSNGFIFKFHKLISTCWNIFAFCISLYYRRKSYQPFSSYLRQFLLSVQQPGLHGMSMGNQSLPAGLHCDDWL